LTTIAVAVLDLDLGQIVLVQQLGQLAHQIGIDRMAASRRLLVSDISSLFPVARALCQRRAAASRASW
jgi:hypothetical protein